jgi:ABC-type multidrug transport system fused ATPase/permease subunit
MRSVLRVFGYLWRYPWMAAGTLGCAVCMTLMVAVFPRVSQLIVDEVRAGRSEKLAWYAGLGLGAFFLRHLLDGVRILLNNTFEQRVIFDLRSDLYGHIQKLPLRWFDNRTSGDIMTRILEDVGAVERVLIDGIEQGVVALLQVGVVLGLMVAADSGLAAVALLPLPFLAGGAFAYTRTAQSRYRARSRAASAMNTLLHDNLAGIRQIKSYVREAEEHRRFDEASDRLRTANLVIMRAWALYSPGMAFFGACGSVLVLAYGGRAVLEGRMSVGDLVGFLLLAGFLYEPIGRLHSLNQLVQAGRAAGERVFEILDEPVEASSDEMCSKEVRILGDVRYREVSFGYEKNRLVVNRVSLHALPGQTVALVGETGAGKTTLVQLLTRFYEHGSGDILLDGQPVQSYERSELRSVIGMVTQESFLFNGSIRQNLLLGKAEAEESEMWAALRAANADRFVAALDAGLDSVVGERGVKLSVGEKQRISIARALLKDPPVLVLDEATASVDNRTEQQIQEALERLMANRTCFVIAHRLSTVCKADQILVLERGRVVERGKHEELLELGGVYAGLWKRSAGGSELSMDGALAG